ncbi:response regulator receiver domain protein [Paenibacillus sp. oral taxon 786 str. D14]|uniref:response regulator n=1 Tax=Paenibacillus sp. oral taxon 786 TaxID=652715 RepID=UPI0001AFD506|nr:response regulator [Paenibacillus sp. oral taxon 786]EES72401.1 response regulator receiver domain protein [Paenibacillus sp. oral taxon 786 str. D14]
MYTAVLVDDEPLVLRGLHKHPVWDQLQIHVAGAFNNGLQALEFIKSYHADILITDIRMPLMSGLELAKQCRQWDEHMKIVMISGYEDFSYAKQALSMNVKDYLLKPIDDAELLDTMQKIREQLDEERNMKRIKNSYHEWFPIAKNEMIRRWIVNNELSAELLHLFQDRTMPQEEGMLRVAIVELDDLTLKKSLVAVDQQAELAQGAMNEIIVFFQQQNLHYYTKLNENQIAVVLEKKRQVEELEVLIRQVRSKSSFTITVGLGNGVETMDNLSRSYIEAADCLHAKMYLGKNRLITTSQVQQEMINNTKDLDEIIAVLLEAVSQYNVLGVYDSIKEFVSCASSLEGNVLPRNIALHLIARIAGFLDELNLSLQDIPELGLNQLDRLLHFETLEDIEKWLRKNLFIISEYLYFNRNKKRNKLIQGIEDYILRNLGGEITLKKVASHFSFTPNYMGRIFKEETGENFSDYVVRIRLKKAAELLREHPGMKIYEAAYATGFNHLPYFTKLFKESFGVSPSEYRSKS